MLNELILYAFVATFIAIVVLGHVLLAVAIIQCARDNLTGGRQIYVRYSAQARRPFNRLLTRSTRSFAKFLARHQGAARLQRGPPLPQATPQTESIWSEWQDLNLRPPRPEREDPLR